MRPTPCRSLETWYDAVNPLPDIAVLQWVSSSSDEADARRQLGKFSYPLAFIRIVSDLLNVRQKLDSV